MSKSADWLPNDRDGILNMAGVWISVCTPRSADWNIPDGALARLVTLREAAGAALRTARNETTRTPVANARCRETFEALIAFMRDFKRRYFLSPPLIDPDYVSLGLRLHDPAHAPYGAPTAHVKVETYLIGRHELGIRIIYEDGDPADPANKGYRIWYYVAAPGEAPPSGPEDLRKSFFTKRRKDVMEFDYGDSGKTVYLCVQVENGGKKGPWGSMVAALIP